MPDLSQRRDKRGRIGDVLEVPHQLRPPNTFPLFGPASFQLVALPSWTQIPDIGKSGNEEDNLRLLENIQELTYPFGGATGL